MNQWAETLLGGMQRLFQMGLNRQFYDFEYICGGETIFLKVLYRSMVAGWIVLAILLLRVLLKRAPKIYSYLLWMLVLYRLLCPFTIISSFSFLGMFETEDAAQTQMVSTAFSQGMQPIGGVGEAETLQAKEQEPDILREERWTHQSRLRIASYVWAAGTAAMLLYGAVSLVFLSRRLKGAVRIRDNIYLSDYAPTPFVIGVVRPRIYLPSPLQEKEMDYILLHEQTHIRRGDHIIRLLSFFALAVYWFHPLVWAAYYLSGKDMEMSCDEAVMRKMGDSIQADYAASLLNLATGRLFSGGTPLAFGEGDTKTRIKNVMRWHSPKPFSVGIAMMVVAVAAVALGTDPKVAEAGDAGQQQAAGVENGELWQAADRWAKAVCDRDGNTIVELCTAQGRAHLINKELLSGEDGTYSFGWSSPWPWDSENGYRIVACTEEDTVILYYAWTSDPHVTVWREHLTWEREGDAYRVGESAMDYLSSISDGDSFEAAYGAGINSTPIDYLKNGLGEALNEHALQNGESAYYRDLFAPETAAVFLLNLSPEERYVRTETAMADQGVVVLSQDGSVEVIISFPVDGSSDSVKLVQPYGEDGIWIPQDGE